MAMFECKICGKVLSDQRGLRLHVEKVHGVKWKEYRDQHENDIRRAIEESKQLKRQAIDTNELEQLIEKTIEKVAPLIAEKVYEKVSERLGAAKEGEGSPSEVELPMEEAEVVGEKVNYKLALNPEIFWRYNVFKAEVMRRGKKWEGTLSDFIDLATKDVLAVYGIYPTVVTMSGKRALAKFQPAEGGEEK